MARTSKKDQEAAVRLWQSSPLYLTPEGLERLKAKLRRLQEKLPGLVSETARTRGYGDTSDNAEYREAKAQSRRTQRQILTIEDQLKKIRLIDAGPSPDGTIRIGSTVIVRNNDGAQKTFRILGPHETDPGAGRLSFESPLGKALMNKKTGDRLTVDTPKGPQKYLILDVR